MLYKICSKEEACYKLVTANIGLSKYIPLVRTKVKKYKTKQINKIKVNVTLISCHILRLNFSYFFVIAELLLNKQHFCSLFLI